MPKKQKKTKKRNNKKELIIAVIVLVCIGAGFGIGKLVKSVKYRTRNSELSVAFYDLPESITSVLSRVITANCEKPVTFHNINQTSFDVKNITQKYDLFLSWDGKTVSELDSNAEKISRKLYANQPSSYNVEDGKKIGVLLDHYEIAYNIEKIQKSTSFFPSTFDELESFLSEMSKIVFCPFICEGSDDNTLLALLSCFIEGKAGSEGYKTFLEEAVNHSDFNSLIDYAIPTQYGNTIKLSTILDELKTWPKKGYTHPLWFNAKDFDVNNFMDDDQVAVVFTSLSEHRKMPFRNVNKYEACRFPVENQNVNHGVICPEVCVVKLRSESYINNVIEKLVSTDVQEVLSLETELSLTSSQGQSYDRQADDVRFWAAACKDGPLPDMYNAVFQNDKEGAAKFAESVRAYLK